MPGQSCLRLQVTALEIWRLWSFTRQDHIRHREAQQAGPDGSGEELPTGQPGGVRPPKRLEGFPASVNADEAKEEDADIHGEIEENRGDPTHKYTQPSGRHVGV